MTFRPILLVFVALAGVAPAALARQAGRYEAAFERDVNRYRWTARVDVAERFGTWEVGLDDRFRSDAFLLFDDRLSFRDENIAVATARRPLSEKAAMRLVLRSDWFSLSRVSAQSAFAGVEWSPVQGLTLIPMVGAAADRRPGAVVTTGPAPMRSDAGPAAGLKLSIPRRQTQGYLVEATGDAFWHRIEPRRSGGARLAAAAERTFEKTRLRAELRAASNRRDAYQAASFLNREPTVRSAEAVESTRSDTLDALLTVEAPVADGLSIDGLVRFSSNNRLIRTLRAPIDALFFDSDFGRRSADLATHLVWRRERLDLRVGAEAGAETERRSLANEDDLPDAQAAQKRDLLRQADYDRGFLTVRFDGRYTLTDRVMVVADGSANGIRHDTPLINLDDRDEVFYSSRVGVLVRPDETFDFDVQLFGTYYHTVYLKAARSAENNVQRSLRLRPSVTWRPDHMTRFQLSSEVRATYTVDDFVLPGRRPTDQSARELRYDLSIERMLPAGAKILADGRFSDLRLGRFLQDVFAEIPFDTLRTTGAWVRLQVGSRTTAELGVRVFSRSDFDRSASVRYQRVGEDGVPAIEDDGSPDMTTITRPGKERILQWGPTTSVSFPLRNGAFLRLEGWYTVQRISRRLYGDLPEGSGAVIRRAASKGERTTTPNLSVAMLWNF